MSSSEIRWGLKCNTSRPQAEKRLVLFGGYTPRVLAGTRLNHPIEQGDSVQHLSVILRKSHETKMILARLIYLPIHPTIDQLRLKCPPPSISMCVTRFDLPLEPAMM